MLAVTLGNGKRQRPQLNDFLLRWDDRRTGQTAEEQLNVFRALASRFKD